MDYAWLGTAVASGCVVFAHTVWAVRQVRRLKEAHSTEIGRWDRASSAILEHLDSAHDRLFKAHTRAGHAQAAYDDLKARAYLRDDKGRIRKASEIL